MDSPAAFERIPKVSILMPVRNGAGLLGAAIASVVAQEYRDWELLVIDDASSDDSARIAQDAAGSDARIIPIRLRENRGAAGARNAGLLQARGQFIAFLDADDRWMPEKLGLQIAFMQETGAPLSFTGYLRRDAKGALLGQVRAEAEITYDRLLERNHLGCLTVIYDRAQTGDQPMPDLPRQHDYALWLRIVRLFGPARGLPQPLAEYTVAPGSLSARKLAAAADTWRVLRHCEGLGLARAVPAFVSYAAYGLRHRLPERWRRGGTGAGGERA
jgi:teichuronic acid biosynthesis glycosyltransferase TuaG